ncbi:MAG: hypothetical protein ABI467_11360 [Kofleriaceae bacterium]
MQKHWCVVVAIVGFGTAACTKQVNVCHQDSDCGDVAYPFCDMNGEYAASGGDKGVCTIVPPDCSPERCGCIPNATTCQNDQLSVCQSDGKSASMTACDLGCSADGTHCLTFAPSNGLGDALGMADAASDAEIPDHYTISTDGRIISDDTGTAYPVKSILLAQSSGVGIRIFIAKSFKIHAVQVRGYDNAIAFVASGPITIDGLVDASSYRGLNGPGAIAGGACAGMGGSYGGGGGGNAVAGGNGSPIAQLPPAPGATGGAAQIDSFDPIAGGCIGGDENGTSFGGPAGGALQFVSRTSMTVASTGTVDVGGGGGGDGGGGGAGGNVLVEAPVVSIDGGITANGGSGGACGISGTHSTPDATPAPGVGSCNTQGTTHSGNGGTGALPPTDGAKGDYMAGAGGGGSVGRFGVRTRDGNYSHGVGVLLSAKISTGTLHLQ